MLKERLKTKEEKRGRDLRTSIAHAIFVPPLQRKTQGKHIAKKRSLAYLSLYETWSLVILGVRTIRGTLRTTTRGITRSLSCIRTSLSS